MEEHNKTASEGAQEVSNDQENQVVAPGARTIAIKLLNRFDRSDSYLDKLLDNELANNNLSPRDKALLTELVNGVIRWKGRLDWLLTGFYRGDYSKAISLVRNALRTALYQIVFLDKIPPYAAINESVEIVKQVQGDKAAGLVNAVLRSFIRSVNDIHYPVKENNEAYYFSVMYSYPKWMVSRWIEKWGIDDTEKFLIASNRKPGVTLRVNELIASIDEIKEYMTKEEVEFRQSRYHPSSIFIVKPLREIRSWDIFAEGKVSAQDISASLAAKLLQPEPNSLVFDFCAAPGGKSFYIAELMKNTGKVKSIEKYEAKLSLISGGAKRLKLENVEPIWGDILENEYEESPDYIFLDAPCSGLGTIAKKPDIKWSREYHDIPDLVATQKEMLEKAAATVKTGGVIVYSVCTIETEETIGVLNWFLANHPNFELDPAENYLPKEVCSNGALTTLPHIHNMDGAFAVRLIKKSDSLNKEDDKKSEEKNS